MGACDWLVSNIVLGVTIHLTSFVFFCMVYLIFYFFWQFVCVWGGEGRGYSLFQCWLYFVNSEKKHSISFFLPLPLLFANSACRSPRILQQAGNCSRGSSLCIISIILLGLISLVRLMGTEKIILPLNTLLGSHLSSHVTYIQQIDIKT